MNKAEAQATMDKLLPPEQQRELVDLTRLAVDRTRASVMSVGQLVDSDLLRGAMLSAVALDLLRGSATLMATSLGKTEAEVMPVIIEGINIKLGLKR
ncbi:hypothetical protein [Bradyrhizobium japonicum]|uniref:hypothetical protein n=1 Tax=Bradyrhizobium japonicum TaxID=375 RepID=UPI00200FDC83|nr:hypothetical protein [Bradyrhizobium japonicum]UQD96059.1 hypothetical protein JEY30_31450 [Bradyrhizobium japonicum]